MRGHLPSEREPMELFLFKTCALILYNMKNQAGVDRASPAAVTFFFESIETGSTHYVQRAAAHCAGILSHAHLPFLLDALQVSWRDQVGLIQNQSIRKGRLRHGLVATPSGFSSSRWRSTCLASTKVTMPSSFAKPRICSSIRKV